MKAYDVYMLTGKDASKLYNSAYAYPTPFDSELIFTRIATEAFYKFAGLKVNQYFETEDYTTLIPIIANHLHDEKARIDAYNKALDVISAEEEPTRREVRIYGEDTNTMTTGARSTTASIGATSGESSEYGTAYDTTAPKLTGKTESITGAATNSTSTTAATDITTRDSRTDTVNIYDNIKESEQPEIVGKWLAISNKPVAEIYEKLFIEAFTIPYYEE